MSQFLAMDIGQSGSRLGTVEPDGSIRIRAVGPGFNDKPGVDELAGVLDVAEALRAEWSAGPGGGRLAVGSTVITNRPLQFATRLGQLFQVGTVFVAADFVTAHVGALDGGPGVCMAAGTGAVALAASGRNIHRSDGWGHVIGDSGSGYWLGRAGLEAAMRAVDGRPLGSARLLARATQHFGVSQGRLSRLLARMDQPVAGVASFAPMVIAHAESGDSRAFDLVQTAAEELADTTAAAIRGCFEPDEGPVVASWSGGLLTSNDYLRERFTKALIERMSSVTLRAPVGSPLDGAALLARKVHPDWVAPFVTAHSTTTRR